MSIDVEGAVRQVLTGFDHRRYRFRCMTVVRPNTALREGLARAGSRMVKELPALDAISVHQDLPSEYVGDAIASWTKKF